MAKTIKTQLREVKPKPEPTTPYRFGTNAAPYANEDLAAKWYAAVAWLRRGKRSRWLLDNVAPPKWRDVFDDNGQQNPEWYSSIKASVEA